MGPIPGITGSHLFRIDWNPSSVAYWIDGNLVASHAIALTTSMRPAARDQAVGGGAITMDWMRMSPYAASGTYTSTVINALSIVDWVKASWTADTPAGTDVVVSYRTGNTNQVDATWTPFTTVPTSGAALGASSKFLQFRCRSRRGSGQTPVVRT
jgi:hypothetical protein